MADLMQPVSSFSFNSHNFDVYITAEQEPLFLANQVCAVLEYANPWKALSDHVDEGDLLKSEVLSNGGIQKANFINESGLYSLILGSRKPQAKEFKRWVTSEVLPSIRKTGTYSIQDKAPWPKVADDAEAFKRICLVLNNTQSVAAAQTAQFISREHGRDVKYLLAENVSDVQDMLMIPTELGKLAGGMCPKTVNMKLAKAGLQEKVGKRWVVTDKGKDFCQIIDVGKSHSDGTPVQQIKWYREKVLPVIQ